MEREQEQPSGKEPEQALPVDGAARKLVSPPVEPGAAAAAIFEAAVTSARPAASDQNEEPVGLSSPIASNFTGLPIRELIGAPLKAAAESQYDLTATMISYIEQVGFQKKKEGDP